MAFNTKEKTCDTKENLLTRQSSLFKRERRGDSQRVITNRLTCQRTLSNRRERQGDSPCVIANRLTCQRALCNRRERQGDRPRVIANRLTCQRALCNRRKRQGGSPRVTLTDLVHRSSTTVQNRAQCKENSTRSNENLSVSKLIKTTINTTSYPGYLLLGAKYPGMVWSRDPRILRKMAYCLLGLGGEYILSQLNMINLIALII
jgi:hypothetical protein